MSLDIDKIKKLKKKDTTTFKRGKDGKLYTAEGLLVSGEGMARMSEKERQMIADILAEEKRKPSSLLIISMRLSSLRISPSL